MEIYEMTPKDMIYPKTLLQLPRPPKKIYAMGNINLLQNKTLAIVGTRKNTEYGRKYTIKFARELSNVGITIVSGLALGIDAIAHRSSMNSLGRTIAVIGSGFNNVYPEENKKLYQEILKNDGCIISEYAPNTKVNMMNFPTRNRIIAGLSCGVLVIEAKYRSGSSITARKAIEQNKPVFCLPNRIGETTGVGTNNLIKIGAHLVTDVNEILIEIGENQITDETKKKLEKAIMREEAEEEKNQKEISKLKKMDRQYMSIYRALQKQPLNIEELALKTRKSIIELNQKITIMEIEGLVEICPGNTIKIKE